jgi:predicted lactoylglutathione lyase
MFNHVGLRVSDVGKSARFYQAALEPLGHILSSQDADGAGLGPPDQPALWLHRISGAVPSGVHLAFGAASRNAVDQFHAAGLRAGGSNNGKPGFRDDYGPSYYAAFLIDPDGNNVEAVCLNDSPGAVT